MDNCNGMSQQGYTIAHQTGELTQRKLAVLLLNFLYIPNVSNTNADKETDKPGVADMSKSKISYGLGECSYQQGCSEQQEGTYFNLKALRIRSTSISL
jgi:hypothetical protein